MFPSCVGLYSVPFSVFCNHSSAGAHDKRKKQQTHKLHFHGRSFAGFMFPAGVCFTYPSLISPLCVLALKD